MSLRDDIASAIARSQYATGTALGFCLLGALGQGSRIHASVRYWRPSAISIGKHCEVRHDVSLDARSVKAVGITIGNDVRIKDQVSLAAYGGEIVIGDRVLIGRGTTVFGHGGVYIGNDTMISPGCIIVSSNHITALNGEPFQSQGFTRVPIRISENVWLGANVTVLAGSMIEANTVIGAGTVVRGAVKGGCFYAGVPAKFIKYLASENSENNQSYKRTWDLFE
jgi:acetyltransferase-like isoleucine patch superfamily enzyme